VKKVIPIRRGKLEQKGYEMMLCPICNLRPLKRKTCGSAECQKKYHHQLVSAWWRRFGKVYNGKRK
jgi:hypothetical protein